MADTGVDIDLYADMESEFPAEDFNSGAANDSLIKSEDDNGDANEAGGDDPGSSADLYDDVLTNIKDDKPALDRSSSSLTSPSSSHPTGGAPSRRYQCYVGNLTWWTTDADIADAVLSVGVSDFIEVKFYENRANGQSKGFCCVSLASEASMRTVMEKLPKKELHGQAPVVTYATKQALTQFEAQSKTRPTPPPGGQTSSIGGRGPPPMGGYRSGPRPPTSGSSYGGRPPLISQPPRPTSDLMRGPPPGHGIPPPGTLPPMRLPPPPNVVPPPPHLLTGPPPGAPRLGILPPHHGPAPHVNPAFFPPGSAAPGYPPPAHGLSEIEFEEIMARNRTVSSSAINRAVQDAASNDYGSAIETLVTAISLIKQSKVAHDDRCRILISSLQDTLHGIESKSYGARRERSRSRDRHRMSGGSRRRSYSRERDYRDHRDHHRDYYRDRSRSRERDYRREEKYYEERYKSHREPEARERPSREDLDRGAPREHKDRDRERSRH